LIIIDENIYKHIEIRTIGLHTPSFVVHFIRCI